MPEFNSLTLEQSIVCNDIGVKNIVNNLTAQSVTKKR